MLDMGPFTAFRVTRSALCSRYLRRESSALRGAATIFPLHPLWLLFGNLTWPPGCIAV